MAGFGDAKRPLRKILSPEKVLGFSSAWQRRHQDLFACTIKATNAPSPTGTLAWSSDNAGCASKKVRKKIMTSHKGLRA